LKATDEVGGKAEFSGSPIAGRSEVLHGLVPNQRLRSRYSPPKTTQAAFRRWVLSASLATTSCTPEEFLLIAENSGAFLTGYDNQFFRQFDHAAVKRVFNH
jgi:hypothetical protein